MDGQGYAEVTTPDGFTVSSNTESQDEIQENLVESTPDDGTPKDPKAEEAEKVAKAARELGKKGGEATAKARAAKAEEKPDRPKAEPTKADAKAEDGEDQDEGNPRHNPIARMREATRREAEAKRILREEREEREQLKREVESLKRVAARYVPPEDMDAGAGTDRAPAGQAKEPQPEDFDDYGQFVEARARHAAAQEYEQRQQAERIQQAAHRQTQTVIHAAEQLRARFAEAVKTTPEIASKISEELLSIKPTPFLDPGERPGPENALADLIMISPRGIQVALHLSENQDDLEHILRMPNREAIQHAFAQIEGYIRAKSSQATQATKTAPVKFQRGSNAAPPIKPIGTASASGSSQEFSEDDDLDAHIAKAQARGEKWRGR